MEEKKKKKKHVKVVICLLGLLLILSAATVVAVSMRTDDSKENDKELRKQLADVSVTEITLSEDVEVGSPLQVNGSKTIIGSGVIKTADGFATEDNSALLTLSSGADVTIGGSVTVDAANADCAVYVADEASLTLKDDAKLMNASCANIYTLGEVTQSGGTVEAGYDNVYIADGGSFLWESGTNFYSVNHGIHVEEGASLHTTTDQAEMREAGSHGVYLKGEAVIDDILLVKSVGNQIDVLPTGVLTMNGGAVAYGSAHGVSNQGTMVMNGGSIYNHEYCGVVNTSDFDMIGGSILNNSDKGIVNKNGGKLTIVNAGASVGSNASGICNEENAYCELAYAKISGNKTNNVINLGESYIHDITLQNSGSNSLNTQYGGHTTMKNVVIDGTAGNHGIYCAFAGVIEMENVTIKNTAKRGIQNYDGTITGSNVAFENIGNCAIASLAHARLGGGTITLDKVTTKDVKAHNIFTDANGAGVITLTNSTLGEAGSNNIAVKNGEVYLTNVKVNGNVKEAGDSAHGVYATGGKLYMKNCTISNAQGSAIRNNGGYVELDNLKTSNIIVHNIFASNGTTILKNSTLAASKFHHIYCKGGNVKVNDTVLKEGVVSCLSVTADGAVTVNDSTFEATTSNNVTITGGTTTLNNTKVLGNQKDCTDSTHGVYVKEGGKIYLNNSTISDTTGSAIRNAGGYVEATKLEVANIAVHNVFASAGETVLKDSTLAKSNYHHIYGKETGVVTIENCTLDKGVNSCVSVTGSANVTVNNSTLGATTSNNIMVTKGKVTIKNTNVLGTTKKDCHGLYAKAGEVYIENTTIKNTKAAALRNNGAYIEATGLTTESCGSYTVHSSGTGNTLIKKSIIGVNAVQNSIYASGGTITLEGTTVFGTTKADTHGVYATGGKIYINHSWICDTAGAALRNNGGYIEANDLTTENMGTYNIYSTKGETVVKASSLCATTTQNNIYVDNGTVTLSHTSVLGTTKSSCHGVYVVKGDAYIQDSYICNTTGAAVRNNTSGNVTVSNLTVKNIGKYNVHHSSTGSTIIKDSTLAAPNAENHIYCTTAGKVTLENCNLESVSTNSIKTTGGTLTLNNTNILGTNGSGANGIYATGGTVNINNSCIGNIGGSAVRNNGSTMVITNLKTENITDYNVFASTGSTTIADCTFELTNTGYDVRINKGNTDGKIVLKGKNVINELITDVADTYVEVDGVLSEGSRVVLNPVNSGAGSVVVQSASAEDMLKNMKYLTLADAFLAESMRLEVNSSNETTAMIGIDTNATEVARVNGVTYDSLQAAVNTATNATKTITVEVLKNIYMSEAVSIPSGCNVTIMDDGTARTISRYGTWKADSAMFTLGDGSALTFASSSEETNMLTLDGRKASVTATANTKLAAVPTNTTVTVKAGVTISNHAVTGTTDGAITVNGGTLNLAGASFTGNTSVDVSVASGNVTVDKATTANIYVAGENLVKVLDSFDAENSNITLTYDCEVSDGFVMASCVSADVATASVGGFTLNGTKEGYALVTKDSNLVIYEGIVRVGTTLYKTLQAAVDAAATSNNTATLEILTNISLAETVSIPAGYNITIKDDGVAARTISRSANWTGADSDVMFTLGEGSTLSFASTSASDDKIMLTVDGNKSNVTATTTSRMVVIPADCTLNIAKGVQISNHKITDNGGAILMNGGSMIMTGGKISENEAANGGAVEIDGSDSVVTITNGTFYNNTVTTQGGALKVNAKATVTLDSVSFVKNISTGTHGGAIRTVSGKQATITIQNCIFESNEVGSSSTNGFGGAISSAETTGTVTLTGNKFNDNKANGKNSSSGGGGAINVAGNAVATMNGNTFSGNTGAQGSDVRMDKNAAITLSGKQSFTAYWINNGTTTPFTLDTDFDTQSAITLIRHVAENVNDKLVSCSSEDAAKAALKCFTLSGTNLENSALSVSGSNLVLVEKTPLASLMSLFTN